MRLFKRFAKRLPERWQSELKRIHFGRQIVRGTFATSEPEYEILPQLIKPGDWVIDVGANVGHYTKRFSELVGVRGRVIAFEPVPATFALLAANARLFAHANVTLINAAVSNQSGVVGMSIPRFATGLNYYQAHLSSTTDNALTVLSLSIDSLAISQRIALVKIDAEGHESLVLDGMQRLLSEHHPLLIVETDSKQVSANLSALGYVQEKLHHSPNVIFKPTAGLTNSG
jgi:FkbM family methyltransferase